MLDFDLALYARGLHMARGQMALGRILEQRRRRKRAAGRMSHGKRVPPNRTDTEPVMTERH